MTSPINIASHPSLVSLIACNISSAFSGITERQIFPSFPTSKISIPKNPKAVRTPSFMGICSSEIFNPRRDFVDHSFNRFANPPLVGSLILEIPPTPSAFSIILFNGATSDFMLLSNP